jgi:hypothetical protein
MSTLCSLEWNYDYSFKETEKEQKANAKIVFSLNR